MTFKLKTMPHSPDKKNKAQKLAENFSHAAGGNCELHFHRERGKIAVTRMEKVVHK
jgi:hypothetical protein